MLQIIKNKIKVGGVIAGEDILVRTAQGTNLTNDKLVVKYAAWGYSDYNKPTAEDSEKLQKTKATRVSITDLPSELIFDFDSENQIPNWELANKLLQNYMIEKMELTNEDFIKIQE